MAFVQGAELSEIIVESGESAKSLNRPGMTKLLALVDAGKVKAVIVAKLDRLTRSVKDLCELLERFERKGVALVSVTESLDTGSAAGQGQRVGDIAFGFQLGGDGQHLEPNADEQGASAEIRRLRNQG